MEYSVPTVYPSSKVNQKLPKWIWFDFYYLLYFRKYVAQSFPEGISFSSEQKATG